MDTMKYASEFIQLLDDIEALHKKISQGFRGSLRWGLTEIMKSYQVLYNRLSPYKVEDKVQLIKTPHIEESSGWWMSRHFLKKGAIGTVRYTEWINGRFGYGIEFDDQSYITSDNREVKAEEKYTYLFTEDYINRIN